MNELESRPHDAVAVAVVGMAGRFPGAPDVDALWERVRRGDDCLTDLAADELIAAGLPPTLVRSPSYVLRAGVLDDVAGFDSGLFGISPRDAALMDPQHRHFLECAWAALESAGCVPERFGGSIGVFAGCGMNTYLLNNLVTNPELVEQVGWFLLRHTGNDKDFLPTFVSYKLDLRGPSVSVQTACSTSLVAIHLATQSLLSFECDLALAGGVTIDVPHGIGYTYRPGEILAPDGRCRAFDAESAGTVLTSGAGVVALRRLADAIDDGDPILAVISGTAVNNDGRRKVGFLAPSVDGHADVVKEALAVAGLSARDIQLVEAHGTGTAVGDPIEVAALTEAFRTSTTDRGFCRLSSTKPNVGHLDTAAGVASLIKVVQALRHATLPPLANHTAPSPLLDIEQTPFVLSADAAPWPSDAVRRAGVSSLGVGGTNAHVVVEEAPVLPPTPPAVGAQVLAMSAHGDAALVAGAERLAARLEAHPTDNLADVAHTLAVGRKALTHRRVIVASDSEDAADAWRDPRRGATGVADPANVPALAFLFPGGGSQYPGMANGFDERFGAFHETRLAGVDAVRQAGGPDLAPILLGGAADPAVLRRPDVSLPAVFITSVALARQWLAWGAAPSAMCGHSLGEYAAAHLAGVLSFDDAVGLVVTRSRLMSAASTGGAAMLVVPLPEATLDAELPPHLSLAVVNADDECVVAGSAAEIDEFARRLATRGVTTQTIPLAAAAHSSLLDPYLDDFHTAVKGVGLAPPQLRYLSNVTGDWITDEQATDPQYWVDHLRGTVRFAEGLRTLLAAGPTVTVELGPGQALTSLARRRRPAPQAAIAALRHADDPTPDDVHTLTAFATQWAAGAAVDLGQFAGTGRRKVPLPTYAFQHQRHWIDRGRGVAPAPDVAESPATLRRIPAVADWFWEPRWVETAPLPTARPATPRRILVIAGAEDPLASRLVGTLRERGHRVVRNVSLDAEALPDVNTVVLLDDSSDLSGATSRWLGAAVDAARHLGNAAVDARLVAVTRGAMAVDGPAARPQHAFALGPVLVAPKEYAGLDSVLVDVGDDAPIATVVAEIEAGREPVAAYRGGRRLVPRRRRVAAPDVRTAAFRDGGTYVITGGLGDIGSTFATHLALAYRANLVIVATTALPPECDQDEWLARHGSDDPTSRRIRRARTLAGLGTRVVTVAADVADPAALRSALDAAVREVGPITGAVHCAGVLRDRLLELSTPRDIDAVVAAKAVGAANLAAEMRRRGAELLVLASSTSTVLAAPGQAAYVAANAYLDALAGGEPNGLRTTTINLGAWAGTGMAATAARRARLGLDEDGARWIEHPVFTTMLERGGSVDLLGRLDTGCDWIVGGHRTAAGRAILPGTGHLELLLGAVAFAGLPLALTGVNLLRPLAVDDDAAVTVRARVAAPDGGRRLVTLEAAAPGAGWVRYCEAFAGEAAEVPVEPLVSPAGGDPFDPLARPRRDLALDPRWECVTAASRSTGHAVAALSLSPQFRDEPGWWHAHPALVDVATAVAVGLAVDSDTLLVPVGYETVAVHGRVGPDVTVVAALRSSGASEIVADVAMLDPGGALVADVRGVRLRGVDPTTFANPDDASAARRLAVAGPFVELAERLGIRAADAGELLDTALALDRPRVIASSVDIDALVAATTDAVSAATTPAPDTPVDGVRERLAALWGELLGDPVSDPDADFFDLGGHSLLAIRLLAAIHRDFDVQLPLAAVLERPTLGALTDLVEAERPSRADAPSRTAVAEYRPIVPIRPSGTRLPLFVIHGAGGNVLFLDRFARHLHAERPVFGIQAIGTDARDQPDPSIDAMVERYRSALRAEHRGPLLLGGFSGGGIVAMELARRLIEGGADVRRVVLFDSVPTGRMPPRTRAGTWANVVRHLWRSGPAALRPFLRLRLDARLGRLTEPPPIDPAGGGVVNLFEHFTSIAEEFTLHAVDVDAILFKADLVWPALPHDYFWTPYVRGDLRVERAAGNHLTMFDPINAPSLGARLEAILEEFGE